MPESGSMSKDEPVREALRTTSARHRLNVESQELTLSAKILFIIPSKHLQIIWLDSRFAWRESSPPKSENGLEYFRHLRTWTWIFPTFVCKLLEGNSRDLDWSHFLSKSKHQSRCTSQRLGKSRQVPRLISALMLRHHVFVLLDK